MKQQYETLSALMDDKLSEQARDQLIADIAQDDELLATWSRYHLIRDTLQGQVHDYSSRNMAAEISKQIEQEPVILAPQRKKTMEWQRPLAGLAIAASVALVAVLGIRSIDTNDTPAVVQTAQITAPAPVLTPDTPQPASVPVPTANVEFVRAEGQFKPVGPRLNSYMVNHYERKGNFGMLPYVRIVGYEAGSE